MNILLIIFFFSCIIVIISLIILKQIQKPKVKNSLDEQTKNKTENITEFQKSKQFFVSNDENLIDVEGNIYSTVKIGNQIWMAENLNVGMSSSGVQIPEIKDDKEWENAGYSGKPAFCYFQNNADFGHFFGKLYNYNAAKLISPVGWHLPTDKDWEELFLYLGASLNEIILMQTESSINNIGSKMKEKGAIFFRDIDKIYYHNVEESNAKINIDATNESKFSARGSGDRSIEGSFCFGGIGARFWGLDTNVIIKGRGGEIRLLKNHRNGSAYRIPNQNIGEIPYNFYVNGMSIRLIKNKYNY